MGSSGEAKTLGYVQEPIAVVGLACRLPGHSNSPNALWEFLKRGGVAQNEVPASRFQLETHHDGSRKPKTMRSPGGMFCENVDPQDFDAQFFNVPYVDAVAMDPQQRQLLEVVYEGLENAGIGLEALDGAPFGCFVGSYAVDYADMHLRDPEDRPPSVTVGIGRAILSNRISHFLNIKGPSFTVDTACSGSLVALDIACRYLNTGEINGAIVAASNLYLSPEHNMDGGAMKGAASPSGRCHTFDVKADGYIKAEATNAVVLKRLNDAIRDGDPVRAVIRASATNSDGRTPGIASPSSDAQAAAIRAAYANAGISDLNQTSYVECHGTGTQAGDPIELAGLSQVFAPSRSPDQPLLIGSIKSNVGHSEPAAGISGLLKAILSIENGIIPGNPTFVTPNPKIDFTALKVRASRTSIPWPVVPFRRVGVNSFGYGGSNAHVILEDTTNLVPSPMRCHVSSLLSDYDDLFADDVPSRPHTLVFSANDPNSLRAYCSIISKYLINPSVDVKLPDLAYTLSERRSRHFHRAFVVADSTSLDEGAFVFGKKSVQIPRIGFVFTGQGAQWSQMGKSLIEAFPAAKALLKRLDDVLQSLPTPPSWSLLDEIAQPRTADHLRLPEFSQPLATALQLALLSILRTWAVQPMGVVGHSSGEIAAACAAGFLTEEEAIKVAYFRGQAAMSCRDESLAPAGMLAVGMGQDQVQEYLIASGGRVQVGCVNSPSSLTLSGEVAELNKIKDSLQASGHFARMLQVDLAYHSHYMTSIASHYEDLIKENCLPPLSGSEKVAMFSSVTGQRLDRACDAQYWKTNMVSTVRFHSAVQEMVSGKEGADFLIEIGPSGALAGPVAQIMKGLGAHGSHIQYFAAFSRGPESIKSLYDVAGRLFVSGGPITLSKVNEDVQDDHSPVRPNVIVDLPNYVWNHSTKYWYESEASRDWRFRQFPHHDLLGSKILGTSWHAPSWKKTLRVDNLHWLRDHKMGQQIVFPAAAFIAMAVEALSQSRLGIHLTEGSVFAEKPSYRLRNIRFPRALSLEETGDGHKIMLSLAPSPGTKDSWHEFIISSLNGNIWSEHCRGLICAEGDAKQVAEKSAIAPLTHTTPGHLWYKAMHDAGYSFGPVFQKHLEAESLSGTRQSRSLVSLSNPQEEYEQSHYPMHPVCIDGCFQTVGPSLWKGDRSTVTSVLVPAMIDNLIITGRQEKPPQVGISVTSSKYVGVGRAEDTKNYMSNASVYDPETGALLLELSGLRYHRLDTRDDPHAAHSYSRVDWKPDVTHIRQDQLLGLRMETAQSDAKHYRLPMTASQVVDMIAHRKPNLRVMEFQMAFPELESVWLEGDDALDGSCRLAYSQYCFASMDAAVLVEAGEKYKAQRSMECDVLDLTRSPDEVSPSATDFDLVIVKLATTSKDVFTNVLQNAHSLLSDGGHILVVEDQPSTPISESDDFFHVNGTPCGSGASESGESDTSTSIYDANGFQGTLRISDSRYSVHLSVAERKEKTVLESSSHIDLVSFSFANESSTSVRDALSQLGWQIQEHWLPFSDLQPTSIVLILDDLYTPTLTNIQEDRWQAIQELTTSDHPILWVTAGSQLDVTTPDNALIHGLLRSVRAEEPLLRITTLDVESGPGPETPLAIHRLLKHIQAPPSPTAPLETEFVERHGVLYTSRIRPDEPVNREESGSALGPDLQVRNLHEAEACMRFRCERIGTLDSLRYAEVAAAELPMRDDCVEVEVMAAGVNFKDVAVSMGIVPENEHLLGLEGAGVIRRLGTAVKSFKIGQRVLLYEKGAFANRIQLTPERVYALPDSLSFEDAATMPSVYLCSIYSLLHVANLQKNQRVLIHSASGGVGISAIQLCQHVGAEIFATVGTNEKRQFLTDTFGIPPGHIFSSRTAAFAAEIMSLTEGKGVDVILNSLTGELLDESWRIVADGGTMVEIGKKDILARNSLSMEPFNRNASFRAVDMSHKQISDALIARLLREMMDMLEKGQIKPISPTKVFPFEDIESSLRYLRAGTHLGKVVISNGPGSIVQVPVRSAPRQLVLRADAAYLIVGGFKGLCGSLAMYLARLGAGHLVVLCRSGFADDKSQMVLKNIHAAGCHVEQVQGDVCVLADVQRAFKAARVPVRGVIQGAMVLRDKIFASMTVHDFHDTISSKVQGTWNLHEAALAQAAPLDFFTMLSSISGVVGQKGQANYAAANVFLDSFAAYRQRLGLPASSVDLGVVEDVGYVAERSELKAAFDASVWTPINEGLLHKILRVSLLQQQSSPINAASSTQLITGIAFPQTSQSVLLRDVRFSGLVVSQDGAALEPSGADEGSREIQALFKLLHAAQAEDSAILAATVNIVSRQFTTSLRLAEPMEPAKSLASYGLDSLAAVEFRNWARLALGAELTTLDITSATSLFSLCAKIIAKISPAPVPRAAVTSSA